MVTIIITAYKNDKFIIEALDSIIESGGDLQYEILVGIDNCNLTLSGIRNNFKKYEKYIKIYFFDEKPGTYVIRNTLIKDAKYEKIIFFDSDDVMLVNMIPDIFHNLNEFDVVRPMFKIFSTEIPKDSKPTFNYSFGVFGINKNIFLQMNGFEPWLCASDGEFFNRLKNNNLKIKNLERLSFFYRKHSDSLTNTPEFNMRSELRKKYHVIKEDKKNNNNFGPLEELVTSKFRILDGKHDLTVIIPTYKNVNFIDECLDSFIKNFTDINYEILVGIDGCKETLIFFENKKEMDPRIKIFFFKENQGPYVVKNTLSKLSNSETLLFFDSDDVVEKEMISVGLSLIKKYDCVKPLYRDFSNTFKKSNFHKQRSTFGEGVFLIKKNVFKSLNGFEPWICAADSEFHARLGFNGYKTTYTNKTCFFRRIHPDGLTSRKDTGYGSKLRNDYVQMIKTKKNWGPLDNLTVGDFIPLKGDFVFNETITTFEEIEKVNDTLNNVLNKKQEMSVLRSENEKRYQIITKTNNESLKTKNINSIQFGNYHLQKKGKK